MTLCGMNLCILAFFFFTLQSCSVETKQNTDEGTTEQISSEELQSENSEAIAALTEQMENGEMEHLLTCEGISGIEVGANIATVKENFSPNKLELVEDHPDGEHYKVKIQDGMEVLVFYSDKGNGNTIDLIETFSETNKLKFGDIYVGMTVKEFNKTLAKPAICTYSEEVMQVGVFKGDVPHFPCLSVSFNIKEGGNISDKLPAALKKKGVFMSDDPELLKLNPYIYALYVATVD